MLHKTLNFILLSHTFDDSAHTAKIKSSTRHSFSDIFTPPNTPSFGTTPQLSVLHDQILHEFGKFCMKFGHFILRKISKFVAPDVRF